MDRNASQINHTPFGPLYINPDHDTLGDLIAQHGRLYVLPRGNEVEISSFQRAAHGCFTIGTYVDRDASKEPASKVFPYRLGNEAVAVEKLGGGKIALSSVPDALRLALKAGCQRDR